MLGVAAVFAAAAGVLSLVSPGPVEADPNPMAEFRTGEPRITVLIFDLLGEDEEERARTEGMNSSVRSHLSKISGLEVVGGRSSISKYSSISAPASSTAGSSFSSYERVSFRSSWT